MNTTYYSMLSGPQTPRIVSAHEHWCHKLGPDENGSFLWGTRSMSSLSFRGFMFGQGNHNSIVMARALRERWLCESAYYVALSFSTKKLASQIRHVLNKRVVGRAGRGGCSTGGTRSSAALPGDARYRSARSERAASRPLVPAPRRAPLILPLDHRHHDPHRTPLQILITFRTTYST